MIVGALLHCMGSYAVYKTNPMALLWADSGGIAELLLAALNLMRVNRPNDRTLAWVCAAGCLAWLGVVLTFGRLIGNILDPRVLIQSTITLVLLLLSLRAAIAASAPRTLPYGSKQ